MTQKETTNDGSRETTNLFIHSDFLTEKILYFCLLEQYFLSKSLIHHLKHNKSNITAGTGELSVGSLQLWENLHFLNFRFFDDLLKS